jgi:hypothetical protein
MWQSQKSHCLTYELMLNYTNKDFIGCWCIRTYEIKCPNVCWDFFKIWWTNPPASFHSATSFLKEAKVINSKNRPLVKGEQKGICNNTEKKKCMPRQRFTYLWQAGKPGRAPAQDRGEHSGEDWYGYGSWLSGFCGLVGEIKIFSLT